MLLTIATILFIIWLLGFSFGISGPIHAFLVMALVVAVYHLCTRPPAPPLR